MLVFDHKHQPICVRTLIFAIQLNISTRNSNLVVLFRFEFLLVIWEFLWVKVRFEAYNLNISYSATEFLLDSMLGFIHKSFFLELELILIQIFVALVCDFQMLQKLTNRVLFCFVLRQLHSMRTFKTLGSLF